MVSECSTTRLAMDTEFTRRSTYYAQLALLQIRARDQRFLVDPLGISQWQPLVDTFGSGEEKILHAPLEDLEVFRRAVGALPAPMIDTQVAAAFAGRGDSLSYAALVQQLFGVELPKSQTQSDWMRRPLSDAQVGYALDDVEWLDQAWEILEGELSQNQKLSWFRQYCQNTLSSMAQEPEVSTVWRRIKGLSKLDAVQQARAAALAEWREGTARERDKPRNWIVRDNAILEMAKNLPTSQRDLERCGVEPESVRRYGSKLLSAAEQAWQSPASIVALGEPASIEQRRRVRQLQELVEKLALEHNMAARLIGSRSDLEQLVLWIDQVSGIESPALLNDWRAESFAQPLLEGAQN